VTVAREVPEGILAARTAARGVLERFNVRSPEDIDVALFAATYGAFVTWSDTGPEDAHVVRVPEGALIVIRRDKRGTERARFSSAHEFAHHLCHPDFDAIARVHGEPRTSGKEFRIEREADAFAVELLMPEALLVDTCAGERPTFHDVADVAWTFGTSLMATGRRWTELSKAPCALLEAKDGVVTRVDKTAAFRADVARGRGLDDALAALHGATLEWADVPETGATLTWAWLGEGWERPKRAKPPKKE
jgi:Zn-dependent peptidase ImmA (M78 family)